MKYYQVKCFWCGKEYNQRCDTVKRQNIKYGHSCCKHCFGKEKSFKDTRSKIMKNDNPFKNKHHTEETKTLLSELKKGGIPWNKGLNAKIDERVKINGRNTSIGRSKNPLVGSLNSNRKGGISYIKKKFPDSKKFKKWMLFRKELLKEDGYRCYKCSKVFNCNELDIHHMLSQTKYPLYIYDISNCVVFCKRCHKQFHKEFGKKKFTPTNTKEFINRNRSKENQFKFC